MNKKPTYEELQEKVNKLEKTVVRLFDIAKRKTLESRFLRAQNRELMNIGVWKNATDSITSSLGTDLDLKNVISEIEAMIEKPTAAKKEDAYGPSVNAQTKMQTPKEKKEARAPGSDYAKLHPTGILHIPSVEVELQSVFGKITVYYEVRLKFSKGLFSVHQVSETSHKFLYDSGASSASAPMEPPEPPTKLRVEE